MNDRDLTQRQNWLRFFPEGTIEFTVVTRVLAIMLLASLLIVQGTQMAAALVALATLLWIDYALVMWWMVQIATDLEDLREVPGSAGVPSRQRGMLTALVATLPAIAVVLLIAPWPEMFIKKVAGRAAIMPVVLPALGAAFVVSAFFARRALKNIMPGRPIWTLLLLVPVLHWFAAHRLLRDMEVRLEQQLRGPDAPASPETTAGTAMTIADLALVLGALGWAAWVIMGSRQTGFGIMGVLVRLFSILFGSLFAIADVAVMENVQRKYVAWIRKR